MAKKKNIIKKSRDSVVLIAVVVLIVGWLCAMLALFEETDLEKQQKLVAQAETFIQDKLYIRAVYNYQTALTSYDTEYNQEIEKKLLSTYEKGGMTEEYYELIEERIADKRAEEWEYLLLANAYVQEGDIPDAMKVLKIGLETYENEEMVSLYESVRYGLEITATKYMNALQPQQSGTIAVNTGEKWGYLNAGGKAMTDFIYEEASNFSGSYACVKIDGVYTLIDGNGYWNAIDKTGIDQVVSLEGTRLVGVKDGKYSIYTNTFNPITAETYDNVYLNSNGLICVQKDGKWAILSADLKPVTEYIFTDVAVNSKGQVFSGDYAIVNDGTGYYGIDAEGNACFEQRFADAKGAEGGISAVADENGKWGFVNRSGELIVDHQYEDAYSFSDNLGAVKYGGKWGYINRYNTMVIESQYEQCYPFINGIALATDDVGYYQILELEYYNLF